MIRRDSGFTLVELAVVALILGVLVTVAVAVYGTQSAKAALTTCAANRVVVEIAAQQYRTENATGAPSIDALVGDFIVAAPQCPSRGDYTWESATQDMVCSVHPEGDNAAAWTSDWSSASGLKTIYGSWVLNNGALTTTASGSQALFTSAVPDDFTMAASLVTLNSGSGYGLYYRTVQGANGKVSGYCFQYDPGVGNKFVVRKVVNGVESAPVASASMPAGYAVFGTSRDVTVTAVGSHTIIKVDGVTVLDFTDSTFASGGVGMRSWNNSNVSIGGVSVSAATP